MQGQGDDGQASQGDRGSGRIPTTSVPSTNPPTITSAQSTLSQQDVQTMFGHSNLPLVWAVEIKAMFHVAPTETYIISNNKHTTLKNACEGPEFRSEPRSMFSAFAAASQQMGNQPMAQSSHSLPASSVAQNIAASNVASAAAPPSRTMSGQVNLQQQQHPAVAMNLGSQSSLTSRGSGAPIGTHAHHQSGSQMSLGSQTSLTSQTSRGSGSSVAMQIQQQTSGQMGSGSVRSSQSSVRQSSTASAAGSLASVPTTCVAAWPWTVNPTTGTLRRQDPSKPVPAPYTYQAVPAPNAPAPQGSLGQGILMGQGSLGRSIDAENEAALGAVGGVPTPASLQETQPVDPLQQQQQNVQQSSRNRQRQTKRGADSTQEEMEKKKRMRIAYDDNNKENCCVIS